MDLPNLLDSHVRHPVNPAFAPPVCRTADGTRHNPQSRKSDSALKVVSLHSRWFPERCLITWWNRYDSPPGYAWSPKQQQVLRAYEKEENSKGTAGGKELGEGKVIG